MQTPKNKTTQIALGIIGRVATLPFRFRTSKVARPNSVSHLSWEKYLLDRFDHSGMKILEVGSRNVTGTPFGQRFRHADYVGFDIYPGDNVDIVGDAHKLSSHFDPDEKFDLIFSSAVFEHLCMPWVVAEEIHKLLKVGGHVFVETHFSFASHERPWNFFQFSDMGLRALFNSSLGFELIEKGMSNPICGYYGHDADDYMKYRPLTELYCHSEILCRKVRDVSDFEWRNADVNSIVDGTSYPKGTKKYKLP